jgi:hypothetical protein
VAKEEGIDAIRPEMAGCNQKAFVLAGSAKDNSKHWVVRRVSQLLVFALLSVSILLYQFLQPAIGGRGQFLKASCHN